MDRILQETEAELATPGNAAANSAAVSSAPQPVADDLRIGKLAFGTYSITQSIRWNSIASLHYLRTGTFPARMMFLALLSFGGRFYVDKL
jgi:hypothetical protein